MASPTFNNLHSMAVSVVRLGRGTFASRKARREPEEALELYEFEACPYCRKVREVLSEMDLEYLSHPCARGSRNRARVIELGGKAQFPFLVDPNGGRRLYESEDIIDYLLTTYGGGRGTIGKVLAPLNTLGATLASALRPRGRRVLPGVAGRQGPAQPLVLYSFESSPYCRKVREALCELDLTCLVKNVAKGSDRRPELVARGGRMMVPYLIDPNTGAEMYESEDIVAYLHRTYGPAAR
jgi:glutathione S-transferase